MHTVYIASFYIQTKSTRPIGPIRYVDCLSNKNTCKYLSKNSLVNGNFNLKAIAQTE